MFWKFNLTTNIDTILDKDNVTLQEIMDESDVLQECKAQNRKLIDFLIRPENLEELVNLCTQEPSDEQEEKLRYKYPNTACELLTSDVSDIYERLMEDEGLMNKVYAFLESDAQLNPLLASFFSKVMGLLINRKSEQILQYLQGKTEFVSLMLRHMEVSAIKDLVLRLISCISQTDIREACILWLNEEKLIEKLIGMIHHTESDDKHCNAAQSLCDIIRLSRQRMTQLQESETKTPDPLLETLQSPEALNMLLDNVFSGEKNESVIISGLSVIQTLLEFRKNNMMEGPECSPENLSVTDRECLNKGVNNTLSALIPRVKDMHDLLLNPPKQHYFQMMTTVGNLDPPLGNVRLQIAHLIATLLINNSTEISQELATLGTLNVLLDLYFHYIWNNFLHTQVEQCLCHVLRLGIPDSENETGDGSEDSPHSPKENSPEDTITNDNNPAENNPLLPQLLDEGRLLKRVMDAWEDNDVHQSKPGGHRRGYMGHLTKIANHLVHCIERGQRLKDIYQELAEDIREKWESFTTTTLEELNKQNAVALVGTHVLLSSSEDDDHEFNSIQFPQDNAMQQAFHDYQMQPMTSTFPDQFGGFSEEDFAEQEERIEAPFTDRISSINFEIGSNQEDSQRAATLFEQACNERMQQFDDADSDDDLWEEKEITFASGTSSTRPSDGPQLEATDSPDSDGSTDSEEELNSPVRIKQTPEPPVQPSSTTPENMDVDNAVDNAVDNSVDNSESAPVAMDTSANSPWSTTASSTTAADVSPGDNWANFASISDTKETGTSDGDWADFSAFNEVESNPMSSTDPGVQRSLSPIEMDTADSNSNPSSKYMVSSAPADLASEASAVSSSTDVSPGSQSHPTSHSCEEEAISSSTSSFAHSGEDHQNSNTTTPTESAPTEQNSNTTTPSTASSADACTASSDPSFLATVGLMKSRKESESQSSEGAAASAPSQSDIEEARANAKKALEDFDSKASPSSHNGPL